MANNCVFCVFVLLSLVCYYVACQESPEATNVSPSSPSSASPSAEEPQRDEAANAPETTVPPTRPPTPAGVETSSEPPLVHKTETETTAAAVPEAGKSQQEGNHNNNSTASALYQSMSIVLSCAVVLGNLH